MPELTGAPIWLCVERSPIIDQFFAIHNGLTEPKRCWFDQGHLPDCGYYTLTEEATDGEE